MHANEFRFVFTARDFDRSVGFYEHTLGMERIGGWDRPDGKGALLSAGGNAIVEVLGAPSGSAYDGPSPSGMRLAIEIEDVDGWHHRLTEAGVEVSGPPEDMPWGHRAFRVRDPDGVSVALYSVIGGG